MLLVPQSLRARLAPPQLSQLLSSVSIHRDLISQQDHDLLVLLCRRKLRRLPFLHKHFDSVITGYRESSVSDWQALAADDDARSRVKSILAAVYAHLPPNNAWLSEHVLELASDGFIAPHVDHLQASGDTVAALSLISPTPVVFRHKDGDPDLQFALLAEPRSLYIQRDVVRYEYTHEIPPADSPLRVFAGVHYPSAPRISIMFRNKRTSTPSFSS
ncbi:hypothetical protein RI367_003949 [Sorochytrium milnesiophthora]